MARNYPLGFSAAPEPKADDDGPRDSTIVILHPDAANETTDPASGAVKISVDDGSVEIHLGGKPKARSDAIDPADFDANLAEVIDADELGRIASMLYEGIQADEISREEWLLTRAAGIELLGLKLEEPRGDSGASSAPVEGQSSVRHPILTEAVIRFQSNASMELLPAGGPCKVRDNSPIKPAPPQGAPPGIGHNGGPEITDGPDPEAASHDPNAQTDDDGDDLAEALELDFNFYFTSVDKGYRPDVDRMLWQTGFGGCAFRKVSHDPIRRMPISRSVDAADLIVSNAANDLEDCGRVTHRIVMRRSTLVRMIIADAYRDVGNITKTTPTQEPDAVASMIANVQGFSDRMQRQEDTPFTIYESYAELNIRGFEHVDAKGNETGLELPYRVTMDKDTKVILEVRRNWKRDDPNCLPKRVFVKYPFVPAFGFYDIGLLHILGNASRALTAAWRMMLDAGMFASFPGFLYADAIGRQQSNIFRIAPGSGQKIQTGGLPIQNVVMPLPYKDPSAGLAQLVTSVQETGQRVGGTADLQVGEGRQDAPVGTTLALIEQAGKMMSAVHGRLHYAQSEEFQLLKERFMEDPEALWRHNPKCAKPWKVAQFIAALQKCDLVPAADPNTSSHMQRIMKAVAIKQLQAMNPSIYDPVAVDEMILKMIGIGNYQKLFAPPPPPGAQPPGPPPDPAKMAALQLKAQIEAGKQASTQSQQAADAAQARATSDAREREVSVESSDRASDRASRERVAAARVEAERIKQQTELLKHTTGLQHDQQQAEADRTAEQQRHFGGIVSDHVKHAREMAVTHAANIASSMASQQKTDNEDAMARGGLVADHRDAMLEHQRHGIDAAVELHKHETETQQADRHKAAELAQAERHHAAEMERAQKDRESAEEIARKKATESGGLGNKPKSPRPI